MTTQLQSAFEQSGCLVRIKKARQNKIRCIVPIPSEQCTGDLLMCLKRLFNQGKTPSEDMG